MFLETLFVLQVAEAVVTVNKKHKVFQQNLLPAIALEYKKDPAMYIKNILPCWFFKVNTYLLAKNTYLKVLSCFLFPTCLII